MLLIVVTLSCIGAVSYWSSLVNQINNKCRNYWPYAYDNWDDKCVCEDWYYMQTQKTLDKLCVKIDDNNFCWEHWKLLSTSRDGLMIKSKCGCEEWYLYRDRWIETKCYTYDTMCKDRYWEKASYSSWTATWDKFDADIFCECAIWFTISEWQCKSKWEIKKLNVYIKSFDKYWMKIWYYSWDWFYYDADITLWWICDLRDVKALSNAYIDLWTDAVINKNDSIIFPTNKAWCTILKYKETTMYWWLRNVLWPNKETFWKLIRVNSKSTECTNKWGIWNLKKKTCVMKKK